jgi:hypothetical protein
MRYVTTMPSISRAFNSIWDNLERDVRIASQPEDGYFLTQEIVTIHWMRETNENGDILCRRMTADEVAARESNEKVDKEGNK